MNDLEPAVVIVLRSRERKACKERQLILGAAGIEYAVQRKRGEYTILVQEKDEQRALEEFAAYARENREFERESPALPELASGGSGVFIYCIVLVTVATLQHRFALGYDWLASGRMQAGLVSDGQWWRTLTALTLHVDFLHLGGNLVFGILFGLFAEQLLGSGLAWISILVAGALGNMMNAWVQPDSHNAVGASTAIFAALGILSAFAWKYRQHTEQRGSRRAIPIVGGVALLAFTGLGGERTDFMAHLTGFGAGMLFGAVYGSFAKRLRFKAWMQLLLGSVALALITTAWVIALRTQGPLVS